MPDDPIDLQALLDTTDSDYPDRPDLPEKKTFFGRLTGEIKADLSKEKKTPFYHLGIALTDPGKDVTPVEMKVITDAGFNLSDYEAGVDFYLTPKSMVMFRRFCQSIGLDPNKTYREKLKLDQYGNPTQDTVEILRGIDVICQTPEKGTTGRVYIQNMNMVAGRKQETKEAA